MKTNFLFLIACLFLTGCGQSATDNRSNIAPNTTAVNANRPQTNTNVTANVNAEQPLQGEKVEKAVTIKFEPGALPSGWQWIDPDQNNPSQHETNGGAFKISLPTGKDLYGENRTAPRLLKAVTGDFQIETRVKFDPTEDYQGAGLLVFRDGNNYLRLERSYGGVDGGNSGMRLDLRKNEEYKTIATPVSTPTVAKDVEMRIMRVGKVLTAFWRENENAEWKELGQAETDYPETVQVGLIGCNTTDPIAAEFAYVKLGPVPK